MRLRWSLESFHHSVKAMTSSVVIVSLRSAPMVVAVNPHVGGEQRMVVCIAGKSYLYNRSKDFVFHKDWNIYAPADVLKLIAKGVTDYDAI
jgi:hypothetical protein